MADMLYDILASFGLTLFDIFTLTTDTARNAVATSKILNSIVNDYSDSALDMDPEGALGGIGDDGIDDDGIEFGVDIATEAELQKVLDNIAVHTNLVAEMSKNIVHTNTSIELINQVNCGTHVFQLAVNDALKESDSHGAIQKVHDMCVLMRNQIVMIELRKLGCRVILPPLENETRWNAKFRMV